MTTARLTVGDSSPTDVFDLNDLTNCRLLARSYSVNNVAVPAGVTWDAYERNPRTLSLYKAPAGTVPITIGVRMTGAAMATLQNNFGFVLRKLTQAMAASGPQTLGTRVVFLWQRDLEAQATYWDITGGLITIFETGYPSSSLFRPAVIRLDALPYGRRPAITTDTATGTLTAWTPGSQLYRADPGSQAEAPLTLQIADKCTGAKAIQRVRVGRRSLQPMGAADFTGIYAGVTCPVTTLNGSVAAGVASIVVAAGTGLAAGQLLLIDAGTLQEVATIGGAYVSGTTVPLAAGLLYAHANTVPVVGVVAGGVQVCPPATKVVDATAANGGGNVARTAAAAAWQSVAAVFVAAGAVQNGRFTPVLRVRDSSAVLGTTQTASVGTPIVTAGGGTLGNATYTAFWVPKNGSNYGAPTGQVSATVQNLTPGGSTAVSTTILHYDRDDTADFRYWTQMESAATASGAQTDWNGSAHAVWSFAGCATPTTGAVSSASFASSATSFVNLPAVPASGILSVRVRFKLAASLTPSPVSPPNTNGCIGLISKTGTNAIGLYASTSLSTLGIAAYTGGGSIPGGYGVLTDGNWHVLEMIYDTTGSDIAWSVLVDGTPYAGAQDTTANPPVKLVVTGFGSPYIGEVIVADQVLGNSLSVASGSSVQFGITHASGEGSGFGDLFLQQSAGLGWYKVASVGNVASYTLSQWPPPAGILQAYPVIAPVASAQFRAGAAVLGRSMLSVFWGQAVAAQRSNATWETLICPPLDCPPIGRAEEQGQDPWLLVVQCLGVNGGTPTCDVDALGLLPHEEDSLTAWWPSGTTPPAGAVWELDTRYDGSVRAIARDSAGNVLGEPLVTGRLFLAPGDNALVPIVDIADSAGFPVSDAVNGKFTLQCTRITPTVQAGAI